MFGPDSGTLELVCFWDDSMLAVHATGSREYCFAFAKITRGCQLQQTQPLEHQPETTCLAVCSVSGRRCILAGQRHAGRPLLTVYEQKDDAWTEGATFRLGSSMFSA